MSRRFALVRLLLGAVLLTAAALKLHGRSVSAVPGVGWFAQGWVQLAAAEWELLLGLWLLSGAAPRAAWLAAVGTFAAFAGVSGYLGAIGVASCGCFGTVRASPWSAFAVDVAALTLLALAWPGLREPFRPPMRVLGVVPLTAAAVLVLLTAVGTGLYGSPQAALARLRGEALSISPAHLDFGTGRAGEELTTTAEVRNWTDHPVRLIGGTSDCSCVATDGLPQTIPAGGTVAVPIRLRVPRGAAGMFTRVAVFQTDCDRARAIRLTLGARSAGDPGAVP